MSTFEKFLGLNISKVDKMTPISPFLIIPLWPTSLHSALQMKHCCAQKCLQLLAFVSLLACVLKIDFENFNRAVLRSPRIRNICKWDLYKG